MMCNRLVSRFLFILFCFVFFNCKQSSEIDDTKVFRLNRYDNITSLDPAFARNQSNNWMANLMYTGLVGFDENLNIVPEIAKRWEIAQDKLTYTFYLRSDVYFHENQYFGERKTRAVKASDFEYSFDRLVDKDLNSSGGFILNNVENYKAVNDTIFQIKLKKAFPPFLGLLCMKYCSVVPREVFDNASKNDFKPSGTGPFQFQYWEPNVKLVLKKNPHFYKFDNKGNRLPYLEYVNVLFLPEKHSEFLQLVQGQIDFMSSLDPSYKDELIDAKGDLRKKYSDRLKMMKSPYLNTEYLCFYLDAEKPIVDSLRHAINFAIDKSKMIKFLRNNIGYPAKGGIIPKGLPGYNPKIGEGYNPQKARKIIYKIKKQNKLPKLTLVTTQEYVDMCEFVQSEMAKVGWPIQVNNVDPATLRDGKANGKFTFFRANWGADYPDAENYLSLFYSENLAPRGPNYSHYKNKDFDDLYLKSLQTTDIQQRVNLYKKMDKMLMTEMPVIPMFYDQISVFLNKSVKGFENSPINMLDLTRVYKEKKSEN